MFALNEYKNVVGSLFMSEQLMPSYRKLLEKVKDVVTVNSAAAKLSLCSSYFEMPQG